MSDPIALTRDEATVFAVAKRTKTDVGTVQKILGAFAAAATDHPSMPARQPGCGIVGVHEGPCVPLVHYGPKVTGR